MTAEHGEAPQEKPTRLTVHYLKSSFFRTIFADGIFGGLTPSGKIHAAFWSERNPIPQQIDLELKPNGIIGQEIPGSRLGKNGIIREVDVDVLMDLETAISFRKWLDEKITILQRLQDSLKKGHGEANG